MCRQKNILNEMAHRESFKRMESKNRVLHDLMKSVQFSDLARTFQKTKMLRKIFPRCLEFYRVEWMPPSNSSGYKPNRQKLLTVGMFALISLTDILIQKTLTTLLARLKNCNCATHRATNAELNQVVTHEHHNSCICATSKSNSGKLIVTHSTTHKIIASAVPP